MMNRKKNISLLIIFLILAGIIWISYYYFFEHRLLVLEERSPDNEYRIKCYEGPEYNKILIVFETSFGSKSKEFTIGNNRRPINKNNFHVYWESDGPLVLISSDPSEMKVLRLKFTINDKEIFSNFICLRLPPGGI